MAREPILHCGLREPIGQWIRMVPRGGHAHAIKWRAIKWARDLSRGALLRPAWVGVLLVSWAPQFVGLLVRGVVGSALLSAERALMETGRYSSSFLSAAGSGFLVASAIARLPAPMVQLGLLLSAAQLGLGWALGGSMVAALGLGSAAGAPVVGQLVDRLGPGRVLAGCLLAQGAATLGLALVLSSGPPETWRVLAFVFLIGLSNPQVGAVARARWSRLLAGRPAGVTRAMAYEGVVDEVTFVVGPLLAGALVSIAAPKAVLYWFAAVTVAAQAGFVLVCWGDPPGHSRGRRRARPPMAGVGRILALLLAGVAVGCGFGATQTALSGTIADAGLVGVVYAAVGAGSAVGGVLAGWLGARVSARRWLLIGAVTLLPAAIGLTSAAHPLASGVAAAVLGLGIGMLLVATYALAQVTADAAALTTVMTGIATSVTIGVSAGAAATGLILDRAPALAWTPLLTGCALALIAALATQRQRDAAA